MEITAEEIEKRLITREKQRKWTAECRRKKAQDQLDVER